MSNQNQSSISFLNFAPQPPLGWNSYNCFGSDVTEVEIRANAEVFARRLKPVGWEYVVVDFCWSHPSPGACANPNIGRGLQPLLHMDGYGRLVPAPNRFPSSAGGHGFKPLADFVHGLGIKFGIHVMRGIPRQAYGHHWPIEGSAYSIDDATLPEVECSWLDHMYSVRATTPAGQAYYDALFRLYASWKVDFVKVDDILADGTDRGLGPYHASEIEAIRRAIDRCGRPMVLSLSPGDASLANAAHLSAYANMWRMSADFWDDWHKLKRMFTLCLQWWPHRRPGAWPDADMLPLGRLCKRGPKMPERDSRFTPDEARTMLTLWSIFRSPLMMGGHLPETDDATFALLTNPEVIAVHQRGAGGEPVSNDDSLHVWKSTLPDNEGVAIALFNLRDEPARVSVALSELGLPAQVRVRDLWAGANRGTNSNEIAETLPAHGASLLRLSQTD